MNELLLSCAIGAAALPPLLVKAKSRLELSKAKHPSLRGHSRIARWLSTQVPFYEYGPDEFFTSDAAPAEIGERRRLGFMRLAALYARRFAKTAQLTTDAEDTISDLRFTETYRVPFQFRSLVRQHLRSGTFLESSTGGVVRDLDGNELFDLTGSYGVNVFGYDFYKECIRQGSAAAEALGPVLGAYHPVVAANARRLREISGLDEVSFHMSGTEAVMQAVRLARYHTGRTHLVRFCGAYHGWWGDVQPGVGNPSHARETYTLKDMDEDSLRVLRKRRDLACVLVNPLQAMHPNGNAPTDAALVDSSRGGQFDKPAYTDWLRKLRAVCTERGIVLIFDEVFLGFRVARRGAQEYFGVQADMVTYGKTLGGGLPVGVLCGRQDLMKRFRDSRPANICFARGTFNSHPYVMAAMHEFLERIASPEIATVYANLEQVWHQRAALFNERLAAAELPVRINSLSSIWSVEYTVPSRYNWMLQYYLRAEGLALSWVGTGRLIFPINLSERDFEEIGRRFVAAVRAMRDDGFWWTAPALTNTAIKRRVWREMVSARF